MRGAAWLRPGRGRMLLVVALAHGLIALLLAQALRPKLRTQAAVPAAQAVWLQLLRETPAARATSSNFTMRTRRSCNRSRFYQIVWIDPMHSSNCGASIVGRGSPASTPFESRQPETGPEASEGLGCGGAD